MPVSIAKPLYPLLLGVAVAALVFAATITIAWQFHIQERHNFQQRFQWYLKNLATLTALLVDGDKHQTITSQEAVNSAAYMEIQQKLQHAVTSNEQLKYIYTYTLKEGKLYYIIDTQNLTKPATVPTAGILQEETEEPGRMREAIEKRMPLAEQYPVDSYWGELISAYAPIYNGKGEFVAMLGVDVAAADYYALMGRVDAHFRQALVLIVLLALICGVSTYFIFNLFVSRQQQGRLQQQSAERFKAAMNASKEAFYILKAEYLSGALHDFLFVDANYAGCALLGVTQEDLAGKKLSKSALTQDDNLPFGQCVSVYESHTLYEREFQLSLPHFRSKWGHMTVMPLSNGIAISIRDITEKKLTEDSLRDSWARFKRINANVPGIVFRLTVQEGNRFSFSYISDRIRDYGASPDEIYQHFERILPHIPPDDRLQLYRSLRRATRNLSAWHTEFRVRHNNKTSWMECRAIPFIQSDGVLCCDGVMVDITDRKKAETELKSSEDKLRLMALALTNSANGVILADATSPDQPVVYVNKAFTDITGYTFEEIKGKNCRILQRRDTKQSGLYILREAIHNGNACRVLLRNYRKDGMLFWNDLAFSPIYNPQGQLTHFVGVMSNVTELKNAQEMLQLANSELRQKNTALEEAQLAIETATAVKRDFLANISHEIRTPVNGMLGTVELLADTRLDEKQHQYIGILQNTSESLLRLINDILDFSRIESGNLQVYETVFPPEKIFSDLENLFHNTIKERQLVLKISPFQDIPKYITGDHDRIRQIMANYISNAIKFTASGAITLSLENTHQEEGRVNLRFSVRDEGIGIPEEYHEYIFNKFTQADALRNHKYGGTGLGLAICRQLAALMQGEVGVNSEEGKGATFWFEAPFIIAEDPASQPAIENVPLSGTPHNTIKFYGQSVLLAEDNPTNQLVTETMLRQFGLEVKVASNGQEAVALFEKERFSLIIMDVQMPLMGGFDATLAIRRLELLHNLPHTPILAFTANALESYRKECLNAGMDDYITKPMRKATLAETLLRYLESVDDENMVTELPTVPDPRQETVSASVNTSHLEEIYFLLSGKTAPLIERFRDVTAEKLQLMYQAAKEGDTKSIAQYAHMLKSSALSLGAEKLHSYFQALEDNPAQPKAQLRKALEQAEKEFHTVLSILEEYEERHTA